VSVLNAALWVLGAAALVLAYARGAPAYRRYQAFRDQQANVRRYESWRGRPTEPGRSSADLMEVELRRRVRPWVLLGVAGFVMVFAGFAIR
jgi:hypothetical protein